MANQTLSRIFYPSQWFLVRAPLRVNEYLHGQLSRLIVEYRDYLNEGKQPSPLVEEVIENFEKYSHCPEQLSVADVEIVELELVPMRPLVEKALVFEFLRSRVKGNPFIPAEFFAAKPATEEDLSAHSRFAIQQSYRQTTSTLIQERTKQSLLTAATTFTILFTVLFVILILLQAGLIWPFQGASTLHPLLFVMLSGVIGGLVSVFKPLSEIETSDYGAKTTEALKGARTGLLLAPIYGLVFSLILTTIIVGGVIKMDLFPKTEGMAAAYHMYSADLDDSDKPITSSRVLAKAAAMYLGGTVDEARVATNVRKTLGKSIALYHEGSSDDKEVARSTNEEIKQAIALYTGGVEPTSDLEGKPMKPASNKVQQMFLKAFSPADASDLARLILWAFIAGYVSGFVPNILSGLAAKIQEQPSKPDKPTGGSSPVESAALPPVKPKDELDRVMKSLQAAVSAGLSQELLEGLAGKVSEEVKKLKTQGDANPAQAGQGDHLEV